MRLQSLFLILGLLFFSVLGLSACQTMSAEECALADWRALGYADAADSGASRFPARQESCNKKGYAADFSAYQIGQRDGLRVFCEPNRGFAFAMRGGSFSGTCAPDQARNFSLAYADGRRVYDARSALSSAQSEVNRLNSHRDDLDRDISDHERRLHDATTEEARRHERDEIARLRRERRDTVDDLRAAQDDAALKTDLVDRLRYDIGARWGAW
jgi:hypothetical protein